MSTFKEGHFKFFVFLVIFGIFTLLTGCGGGGGGSSDPSTSDPVGKYVISGNVTLNGEALAGATVTLSGTSSSTTTTDASGNYSFSGLDNGSYTITPSLTGYTFNVTSEAVTINGASVTNSASTDFTVASVSTSSTYTLSGVVIQLDGNNLPSVTVALSDSTGKVVGTSVTDANGYSFTGLSNGTYTIKPTLACYGFEPLSKDNGATSYTLNIYNPDSTFTPTINGQGLDEDFLAYPTATPTFTLSGAITLNGGTALNGVTLNLKGSTTGTTATITNNTDGSYSFSGLTCGEYIITPSQAGYTFNPPSMIVDIGDNPSVGNSIGNDFTATVNPYAISGTVTIKGTVEPGETLVLTGSADTVFSDTYPHGQSTTTDAYGYYSFSVPSGTYTVTASTIKSGTSTYTFVPQTVTVTNAGLTVNFDD